jgi:hypothetical protein
MFVIPVECQALTRSERLSKQPPHFADLEDGEVRLIRSAEMATPLAGNEGLQIQRESGELVQL